MSEPLRGVLVTHRRLGDALLEAVQCITGETDGLVAVSNDDCSRASLVKQLIEAAGAAPCVVFVDLPGGSCLQAAVHLERDRPRTRVVAGVNLAMLLDFVYHRDATPDEAAARAVETGARAIRSIGP